MVLGHIMHSQQVKHCHPEGFTPEGSHVIKKRSFGLNIHTFPGTLTFWSRLLMRGQAFLQKVSVPSLFALLCLLHTGTAHAACSNPPGVEGEQIYNSTHKVMQYCDGTHWTAMRATGKADQSDLDALISTVDGKVDKSGDTMTGALNLNGAPLANAQAATKEYVDTVVASSIPQSTGGGSAGTCYYTNSACGQGFAQMPGYYGGHSICCSSGFFAADTVPNAFDIADMFDNSAYEVTIESAIFQVSGITTADISISGEGSPEYRLCGNADCSNVSGAWANTTRTVNESQYVQVRATTPAHTDPLDTPFTATLTIGDLSDSWTVTGLTRYLVFVTSTLYQGNLGGVPGADAKCQAQADAAGLPGTYKAWIAGSTINSSPALRFSMVGTSSGFYMPDTNGVPTTKIADNWADLTDGNIDTRLNVSETGNAVPSRHVWTNVNVSGVLNSPNVTQSCSNWTVNYHSGSRGDTYEYNSQWTVDGGFACNNSARLYCFRQQ